MLKRLRNFISLSLVLLFTLNSCTFLRSPTTLDVPRQNLTEEVKRYYSYPTFTVQNVNLLREETTSKYRLQEIEFDFIFPEDLKRPSPETFQQEIEALRKINPKRVRNEELTLKNRIDYFVPTDLKEGEKRPAILISPILGGNRLVIFFAKYFAKRGLIAVVVHRKKLFWKKDTGINQVETYLRTSVMRIRQGLDWMLMQPEVDTNSIGSFGISFGAIMNTMVAALDERIHYHIFAMPAGPLAEVIMKCPENSIKDAIQEARAEFGWTEEETLNLLNQTIRTDPMLLASAVPTEKAEIYIARFDRVVGTQNSLNVWETLGKPKRSFLPFGHYGSALLLPWLQHKAYKTYELKFKSK